MSELSYSGYVAILGRPNVGKSTLLNCLLGQKISITSNKPQTTRHQILGVKTLGNQQMILVDTPGIHKPQAKAMNKMMNKAARHALNDVNVVVMVVEGLKWTEEDEIVFELIKSCTSPVFLLLNKVDKIPDKDVLLPYLAKLSAKHPFEAIIPISAKRNQGVAQFEQAVFKLLPEGPLYFDAEQVTNRPKRFLAAEIIREKLTRSLNQELPYAIAIEIDTFKAEPKIFRVHAIIWVETAGQKGIVVGPEGARLKEVGRRSRLGLESLVGMQVYLKLWVKIKSNWSDNEGILKSLGLLDFET